MQFYIFWLVLGDGHTYRAATVKPGGEGQCCHGKLDGSGSVPTATSVPLDAGLPFTVALVAQPGMRT